MDLACGNRSESSAGTCCGGPEVSVVIPTYNGAARLGACLDALARQQSGRRREVLVVDDGSAQELGPVLAAHPEVRLIRQQHRGPAAARNRGADEARAPLLVFVDDDCAPEPAWLDELLAPLADPAVVAVKGAYLSVQPALIARFVQTEYEEKYARLARRTNIDFVDTYSAAFRRDVLLAHGGFDERFPTASTEDQELSFRLAEAGHQMRFAPGARVFHTHVASLRGYLRKKFKIGYWKVRVLARHPGKVSGDDHTPGTLKLQVVLAAGLAPSSLAALLWPPLLPLPLGVIVALGLSALPLSRRCFRKDPVLGLAAPLLCAGRAAALAAGLIAGSLEQGLGLRLLSVLYCY